VCRTACSTYAQMVQGFNAGEFHKWVRINEVIALLFYMFKKGICHDTAYRVNALIGLFYLQQTFKWYRFFGLHTHIFNGFLLGR